MLALLLLGWRFICDRFEVCWLLATANHVMQEDRWRHANGRYGSARDGCVFWEGCFLHRCRSTYIITYICVLPWRINESFSLNPPPTSLRSSTASGSMGAREASDACSSVACSLSTSTSRASGTASSMVSSISRNPGCQLSPGVDERALQVARSTAICAF